MSEINKEVGFQITNFRSLLFLQRILICGNFSVDRLVLAGHTIYATGHLGHIVIAIDKSIAILANAYESMK